MVLNQLKQLLLVTLLGLGAVIPANAAGDRGTCDAVSDTDAGSEECLASCTRFKVSDARFNACNNVCRPQSKQCDAVTPTPTPTPTPTDTSQTEPLQADAPKTTEADAQPVVTDDAQADAQTETLAETPAPNSNPEPPPEPPVARQDPAPVVAPAPPISAQAEASTTKPARVVASLPNKKAMLKELEKNADMLVAIRAGNLSVIRRLIELQGLNPTYVYGYEYSAKTRVFEGSVTRMRLADLFADTNTLRNDAAGLDRMLALFLELGMDVKATLPMPVKDGNNGSVTLRERTAWGPSLIPMEVARDRAARLRAFELALQAGLMPNDDFGQWIFAELPQVCGRDRSQFSIQVLDLLIKYLGPSANSSLQLPLQDYFWRQSDQGPETVADVLDRSHSNNQAKNAYEKAQAVLQDERWEHCALLSRRINRFLTLGQ